MAIVLGCTFLYSLGLVSLFTAGYFVPVRELPVPNSNSSVVEPFQNLLGELQTTSTVYLRLHHFISNLFSYVIISELEDTFSFVLTVLRVVGILLITMYVAIGLGAGPIKHIRGYSDPREELVNGTLKTHLIF